MQLRFILADQMHRETEKMDTKNILSKITNDFHIPVALIVFAATSGYHFYTRLDLGTNYVDSIKAFYLFLAAHAGVYQKWPDKSGSDSQTGANQ